MECESRRHTDPPVATGQHHGGHGVRTGAVGGGAVVRFDGRVPVYVSVLLRLLIQVQRFGRLATGCFLALQGNEWVRSLEEELENGRSGAVCDDTGAERAAGSGGSGGVGDTRLKGTRFIWIKGPSRRRPSEDLLIEELSRSGLKVGRAWAIKEAATRMWQYTYRAWALKYFQRWYFWATHSQLPAMIRVAKTMKRYLPRILNYLRHHQRTLGRSMPRSKRSSTVPAAIATATTSAAPSSSAVAVST